MLQAPAANEAPRTRDCLSEPCSPLDTSLNFRFLLTLEPSGQSELTDANPLGHLGGCRQRVGALCASSLPLVMSFTQ